MKRKFDYDAIRADYVSDNPRLTLKQIAAKHGCSVMLVFKVCYDLPRRHGWTPYPRQFDHEVIKQDWRDGLSYGQIQAKHGCSQTLVRIITTNIQPGVREVTVTVPAWLTPEIRSVLGCVPDVHIAEALGMDVRAVWRVRTKLGIPHFSKHGTWREQVKERLGKVPDTVLCKEVDVDASLMSRYRKSLGIARCKAQRVKVATAAGVSDDIDLTETIAVLTHK